MYRNVLNVVYTCLWFDKYILGAHLRFFSLNKRQYILMSFDDRMIFKTWLICDEPVKVLTHNPTLTTQQK